MPVSHSQLDRDEAVRGLVGSRIFLELAIALVDKSGEFWKGPLLNVPTGLISPLNTMAVLDQIKTIIIVMMENRSFDHFLGYRSLPLRKSKDVDGLNTSKKWLRKFENRDGDDVHTPFHSKNPHSLPADFDPPHERSDIAAQIGTPKNSVFPMNGFVGSLPSQVAHNTEDRGLVMGYFGGEFCF